MKLRPGAHGLPTLADGCKHGQGTFNGPHGLGWLQISDVSWPKRNGLFVVGNR